MRLISQNACSYFPAKFINLFKDEVNKIFQLNKDKIFETIIDNSNEKDVEYKINCYRMHITTNWNKLYQLINKEYLNKK